MEMAGKVGLGVLAIIVILLTLGATGVMSLFANDNTVLPVTVQEDSIAFVSGTEYSPGQEGQVAVMVVDAAGNAVTLDYNCTFSVLYPNKTLFVDGNFTESTSLDTWYTNFTIPAVDGVYEYGAECIKGGKTAISGKSFHVTKKRIRAVHVQ